MKKLSLLAVLALSLAACSQAPSQQQEQGQSQVSSQAARSSQTASSSSSRDSLVSTGKLDGTYTARDWDEDLTLTLKGKEGQLTTIEVDGEQEMEPVELDEQKGQIRIDDEWHYYEAKDNQLIINDLDNDADDRLVFTKK